MKKRTKLSAFLLSLLLLISLTAPAFAEGKVSYSGTSKNFIFAPGSSQSPTDLFANFKNVMPGDTLTERLVIRNDTFYGVKINLYIRSLGAQLGSDDLLSQMELSVQQVDDSYMFKAPANQTAQLTNWTYIGTIYSGGEVVLDLTLKVPMSMGNEFQGKAGYIDWQFMVEELPVSPDDPSIKTGDESEVLLYAAFAGSSLAVAFVLLVVVKRRKKAED